MEVTINGERAELGNSLPAISKKFFDLQNPSARFIDISNSFDLPDTDLNRRLLGSPKAVNSTGDSIHKYYDVEVFDVYKIFEGKGFINRVTDMGYSIQVVDTSKVLFDSFKKNLRELNFDSMDTALTTTQIDALDSIDLTNVWFWGKMCSHELAIKANTDQTTGDARCKYSRPCLNINALINAVVIDSGYSYAPSGLELFLNTNSKDFFFTNYQKTINTTYNVTGTLAISGLNTNDFEEDVVTTSTSIDIGTNKAAFRIRGTFTSSAVMSFIVRATDSVDTTKITVSKFVIPGSGYVDFLSAQVSSAAGIDVDFEIVGTGDVTFDGLIYSVLSEKDADLSGNPFLGYKIKVHDNLPELTYMDLFRTMCVAGNKSHSINVLEKAFSYRDLGDVSKNNATDWSEKFIQKSETITTEIQGLSQKNYLTYSNDLTVDRDLGRSFFVSENSTLQEEGVYLSFPFGASAQVTIEDEIAHISVYNDTGRIIDQELSMRLLYGHGDLLQFEPISWGRLKDNYSAFFRSLNKARVVDASMYLSKLDFLSFDFETVYVDYFKSVFWVLGIGNFIAGKQTSVKLLKY